ncbi:unnamed protein product [Linum tenue]|uniref:Uncharacterized protein n=1 Tax=Linum tenue TaxID=586396 RepID=A0AAV0IWK1_9ROSI|nr:unnamed protein product [Linum tenue]
MLAYYRQAIDSLTPQSVSWTPYGHSPHLTVRRTLYQGLLRFAEIAEYYDPTRCLRQLGYVQVYRIHRSVRLLCVDLLPRLDTLLATSLSMIRIGTTWGRIVCIWTFFLLRYDVGHGSLLRITCRDTLGTRTHIY